MEITDRDKPNFKVDEKLKHFISRPTNDEKATLEKLILSEGVKVPLTVWDEEGLLVDGHTRLEICQKHGLKYEIDRVSFPSKNHVTAWMVDNQMGRRNLTPEQMSYLRGERYKAEKGIRGGDGSNQYKKKTDEQLQQGDAIAKGPVRNIVGKEYGVHPSTIDRDYKFSKAVNTVSEIHENPTEIKDTILSGKKKISKKAIKDIAIVAETDKELAKNMLKEEVEGKKKPQPKLKAKAKVEKLKAPKELPPKIENAFDDFIKEIAEAKKDDWRTVDKETIRQCLNSIIALIDN